MVLKTKRVLCEIRWLFFSFYRPIASGEIVRFRAHNSTSDRRWQTRRPSGGTIGPDIEPGRGPLAQRFAGTGRRDSGIPQVGERRR